MQAPERRQRPMPGKESYTRAGWRQIQQAQRHDALYYAWRGVEQVLMILLIGIGAYISYGIYRGQIVWQWEAGFWAIVTLKNLCEFMARRWK